MDLTRPGAETPDGVLKTPAAKPAAMHNTGNYQ
jgi:hypothetical protein